MQQASPKLTELLTATYQQTGEILKKYLINRTTAVSYLQWNKQETEENNRGSTSQTIVNTKNYAATNGLLKLINQSSKDKEQNTWIDPGNIKEIKKLVQLNIAPIRQAQYLQQASPKLTELLTATYQQTGEILNKYLTNRTTAVSYLQWNNQETEENNRGSASQTIVNTKNYAATNGLLKLINQSSKDKEQNTWIDPGNIKEIKKLEQLNVALIRQAQYLQQASPKLMKLLTATYQQTGKILKKYLINRTTAVSYLQWNNQAVEENNWRSASQTMVNTKNYAATNGLLKLINQSSEDKGQNTWIDPGNIKEIKKLEQLNVAPIRQTKFLHQASSKLTKLLAATYQQTGEILKRYLINRTTTVSHLHWNNQAVEENRRFVSQTTEDSNNYVTPNLLIKLLSQSSKDNAKKTWLDLANLKQINTIQRTTTNLNRLASQKNTQLLFRSSQQTKRLIKKYFINKLSSTVNGQIEGRPKNWNYLINEKSFTHGETNYGISERAINRTMRFSLTEEEKHYFVKLIDKVKEIQNKKFSINAHRLEKWNFGERDIKKQEIIKETFTNSKNFLSNLLGKTYLYQNNNHNRNINKSNRPVSYEGILQLSNFTGHFLTKSTTNINRLENDKRKSMAEDSEGKTGEVNLQGSSSFNKAQTVFRIPKQEKVVKEEETFIEERVKKDNLVPIEQTTADRANQGVNVQKSLNIEEILNIPSLVNEIYLKIEKKLKSERRRRGL